MTNRTHALLLVLSAVCSIGLGADDYPILIYPCPLTQVSPNVDGVLKEDCWAKASPASGFTLYQEKHKRADVQTTFRLLYDQKALYVAVQCDEPLAKRMTKRPPSPRDDHPAVFAHEAIELFIDPLHDHTDYYQIAISVDGTIYDGRATDVSWDSRTKAATSITAKGWILEAALFWEDCGVKVSESATLIGFNICRDRNIAAEKQYSLWSATEGGFHDPGRFGHVVLGGRADDIGALRDSLRRGGRRGPIQVCGNESLAQVAYVSLARAAFRDLEYLLANIEEIRQKERSEVLAQRIALYLAVARQEVAPLREKLDAATTMNATELCATEMSLSDLGEKLRNYLWEIRLESLLAEV